jgi:hypothetical protein
MLEEAGVRIHGTTRQQPLERFLVEKPLMRALPEVTLRIPRDREHDFHGMVNSKSTAT